MSINELNLLVVEDDAFQRQLIVNMLRSLGATTILEAGDGRQALAVLRDAGAAPVDIVICDLSMPEMDGMEFLRQMGRENHHPAVVVTSALDDMMLSSAERMAKMHGIRLLGVAQKPISLSYLKDLLAKHG